MCYYYRRRTTLGVRAALGLGRQGHRQAGRGPPPPLHLWFVIIIIIMIVIVIIIIIINIDILYVLLSLL